MTWIIASIPLWVAGGLLLIVGSFGVGSIAFNNSDKQTFQSGTDGDALMVAFSMIIASAPLLWAAAKVAS